MEKQNNALNDMAHLVGEMTEAAYAGQAVGLQLLAAEMQALSQLMPGMAGLAPGHLQSEAEVEADFDNMPV